MRVSGIDFPDYLLDALHRGKLVVFAGAGVSMGDPANLPDFDNLAHAIAQGTGLSRTSGEQVDAFLGRLAFRGVAVNQKAAELLTQGNPRPTSLHRDLLRLFGHIRSVRIVTTNFDQLFEEASGSTFNSVPEVFGGPALPLGKRFQGIVHLHGSLMRPDEMILTDQQFGQAYLTEEWARRFVVDLFRTYSVLFIGYSHSDIIMNYLARALRLEDPQPRFVLAREGQDNEQWASLGISPIFYPDHEDGSHSALYQGVSALSDVINRGTLEWRFLIHAAARQKPSLLTQEEEDNVQNAFSDETRLSFFTDSAFDSAWVTWLDSRGLFDNLFTTAEPSAQEVLLSQWLATRFSVTHSSHVFNLIAKHGGQPNAVLWENLCTTIGGGSDSLDPSVLDRWVSVLVNGMPTQLPGPFFNYSLARLAQQCSRYHLFDALLDIVAALSVSSLPLLQADHYFGDDESSNHYIIKRVWDDSVAMHLDALAEPLLSLAVRGLWRRYVVGRTWRNNNRYFDAHSWGRAAIEPHSQNKQPRVTDALLDMARDCLSHIAERNITVLQCWCDYLVASDAPLLRRLAIHTMAQRGDLSADSKVDWLLSQTDIHEIALHHEIYQALRIIYPSADSIHRQQIIDSILKYQMPRKGDIDSQRLTAYHRFSLFNWLHEAFPGCKLALERLNEVIREYPYFEARDHPDLTHWITSEQYLPLSPWTVESLLSRPAGEWREELLAFQDDSMSGPNREGVKDAIREALRQDYEWGFKLASALVANENWDSYIWSSIVEAWSDELTARQHRQVLQLLDQPALLAEHPSELSDLLLSLVKKNTAPYPLVVEANPLAAKLKNYIIQDKRILSEADWLQQAINHPAGALAEYWLHSLTIHRKQYPDRAALNEEYLSALSKIVEDETLVGHLGKAILGRNVHFLLDTDSEWTKKYFLPIFNDYTKKEACRAVWAGFMYGRPLTPAVADLMKEYFLEALPYFEELFPEEALRSGFISRYVAMLIYFVEDPFTEWVPRFFQYADSTQHRRHFVDSIGMVLRNTGEAPLSEFWNTFVKPFWQGRLRSIPPPPLEDEEIEAMLDWLPYLGAQFPEAVELVAQTPGAKLDDGLLVFGLKDRGLGEVYPEATAQLMIYLGASVQGLADWRWHLAKDLIDGLLELDLSEDSRTRLQELQVRLGLGDQPEG